LHNPFEIINKYTSGNKSVLFVGIGNVLKKDDGVGVYISQLIENRDKISSLTVETGIENYVGKINQINPDLLVLIDCVDLQGQAGDFRLVEIDDLLDQTTNTHNISLKNISDLFKPATVMLGIQPLDITFGDQLTEPIRLAANKIINLINSLQYHQS
jgi:hydrogenase maturation protease